MLVFSFKPYWGKGLENNSQTVSSKLTQVCAHVRHKPHFTCIMDLRRHACIDYGYRLNLQTNFAVAAQGWNALFCMHLASHQHHPSSQPSDIVSICAKQQPVHTLYILSGMLTVNIQHSS
jgi:hypothetical protein